jgi:hypothetical protein
MYNYRLKKYKNGSFQLTYYYKPVLTNDDKFSSEFQVEGVNYFDEPSRDVNDVFNEYSENPFVSLFDMYKVTDISERAELDIDDDFIDVADDELADNRERALRSSMNRSKRFIYDYGRCNVWEWFFTFTFEPLDGFNKFNYSDCQKKISKWFGNVKKRYCPDIKYLIVPEMHKSGAWHFHALVSNCDSLTFVVAKNNQRYLKDKNGCYVLNEKGQRVPNKYFGDDLRTRYPDGDFIYNIKEFNSGFSTATRVTDTFKSVSYLVKYITKDLCDITFGKRRYIPSLNLDLPETVLSLCSPGQLQSILHKIEYIYNVKLSIDCIKTYRVDVENYNNVISVFEFAPSSGAAPDIKEVDRDEFVFVE